MRTFFHCDSIRNPRDSGSRDSAWKFGVSE
ncbi:hypothetical protein BH10PSE9_BH10PSE9_23830 [soil metagenome]